MRFAMPPGTLPLDVFEAHASHVSTLLRALANQRRLMILCKLLEWGEASVGTLAGAVGLDPSPTSQHLARMREEGLVAFRRDGQTLWYRIADARIETLLATLYDLYCRPAATSAATAPAISQEG
jgi:ArsR family transcriptional regulator